MLEQGHHPRFHLGESLLPASIEILETLGVLDEVRARFQLKRGARFVDGTSDVGAPRSVRYAFGNAFAARRDHAFHVPRDEFDTLLFGRARACGADAREGWTVTDVLWEGTRATGVRARDPEGGTHAITARFVVDATGRDAMMARASRSTRRLAQLDRTSIFTHVRGAWRDTGEREGDVQIVVFGQGEERGWWWLIPFSDGRSSVGVVVSSAWVRARRGSAEAMFDAASRETPVMRAWLAGAERVRPVEACADFSFEVGAVRGEGWLAVGDAAGFIDPLFSTGVHLALESALGAADAIDRELAAAGTGAFDAWERRMRTGADMFLGAVQAFYAGDLETYLFAHPQHPFLQRAVASMLAGDVFDAEARWSKELRARFPVRTG